MSTTNTFLNKIFIIIIREATKLKKIIGIFICALLIGTIIPVGKNATEIYDPLDGGSHD